MELTELAGRLKTDLQRGLPERERAARLQKWGCNKLETKRSDKAFMLFLS